MVFAAISVPYKFSFRSSKSLTLILIPRRKNATSLVFTLWRRIEPRRMRSKRNIDDRLLGKEKKN
jgi:hypothetical protein